MPTYMNPGTIKFKAKIKKGDGGGAYVEFPHDAEKLFGVKGRVPIKSTIDGVEYRGSLVKMGTDCHLLIVLKAIRATIGKDVGDNVQVTVALDTEERKIELPDDVQKILFSAQHCKAKAVWSQLAFTHQREYAKWIESAKRAETRTKRIEEMMTKLAAGEKLK